MMHRKGKISHSAIIPCSAPRSYEDILFDNLDDTVFVSDAQPPQLNILRCLGSGATDASVILSINKITSGTSY